LFAPFVLLPFWSLPADLSFLSSFPPTLQEHLDYVRVAFEKYDLMLADLRREWEHKINKIIQLRRMVEGKEQEQEQQTGTEGASSEEKKEDKGSEDPNAPVAEVSCLCPSVSLSPPCSLLMPSSFSFFLSSFRRQN
jgi:hypothetical protein